MTAGVIRADESPGDGWVAITKWARLWSSIPQRERVTSELIRKNAIRHSNTYSKSNGEAEIEEINNSKCEIAVRWQPNPDYFKPCTQKVYEDASRCPAHGGPTRGRTRQLTLKAENELLRARIAELEGQVPA